jgi:hypothetical protein
VTQSAPLQRLLRGEAPGIPFEAVVHGRSMGSALPDGSRVRVEPATVSDIEVGHIVLHKAVDGRMVAHRVVALGTGPKHSPFIITQGDHQSLCDMPLSSEEILGRVVSIWDDQGWSAPLMGLPQREGWRRIVSYACLVTVMSWGKLSGARHRRRLSQKLMRLRS